MKKWKCKSVQQFVWELSRGDKIVHTGSLGLINFALDSSTLALRLFEVVSAKKDKRTNRIYKQTNLISLQCIAMHCTCASKFGLRQFLDSILFQEYRNWNQTETLHYWLRRPIGFWKVQKVGKSRHLFLID